MYVGLLYAWGSIVDPRPGNGHSKVPSPVDMRMYWLDINYSMLKRSLHADLTSESMGNPKACKVKQDPVDERGNAQYR